MTSMRIKRFRRQPNVSSDQVENNHERFGLLAEAAASMWNRGVDVEAVSNVWHPTPIFRLELDTPA